MPRVTIVIAAWNAEPVLGPCLESVAREASEVEIETIVVDDASTDGTQALLDARDDVTALRNETGIGYCASINRGAALARGDVLLLCNSDVEFRAGSISVLADALDRPGIGLAGPLYERPDGSRQPGCACFPSVTGTLVNGLGLHRLMPDRLRAGLAPAHWSHSSSRDVDVVMGAVQAIRAQSFLELGGYWPRMYASETDLAFRARERHGRVRFVRDARVMHVGDFSNRRRWSRPARAERIAAAELAFLDAHVHRARAAVIRAVTVLTYATRIPLLKLLGRRARANEYAATVRVYVGGRPS